MPRKFAIFFTGLFGILMLISLSVWLAQEDVASAAPLAAPSVRPPLSTPPPPPPPTSIVPTLPPAGTLPVTIVFPTITLPGLLRTRTPTPTASPTPTATPSATSSATATFILTPGVSVETAVALTLTAISRATNDAAGLASATPTSTPTATPAGGSGPAGGFINFSGADFLWLACFLVLIPLILLAIALWWLLMRRPPYPLGRPRRGSLHPGRVRGYRRRMGSPF